MDEDPLEAAKRELLEETGLTATYWTKILTMHLSNSVTDEWSVIYLARGLKENESRPDETEKLIIKKVAFDEAVKMIEEGLITDAMAIAAIQKIQLMLFQGKLKR
jgi:8-oxo-dGTP pyrophosphatase MutT (NUDIX family)